MNKVKISGWKYEVVRAYDGAARKIRLRKVWKKWAVRKARRVPLLVS